MPRLRHVLQCRLVDLVELRQPKGPSLVYELRSVVAGHRGGARLRRRLGHPSCCSCCCRCGVVLRASRGRSPDIGATAEEGLLVGSQLGDLRRRETHAQKGLVWDGGVLREQSSSVRHKLRVRPLLRLGR